MNLKKALDKIEIQKKVSAGEDLSKVLLEHEGGIEIDLAEIRSE